MCLKEDHNPLSCENNLVWFEKIERDNEDMVYI